MYATVEQGMTAFLVSSPVAVAHAWRRGRVSCAATPKAVGPSVPPQKASASNIDGEWFGYEVSFSGVTGERVSIPEWYIPEEYRNWDVQILGFDCVTSMRLDEDESIYVKHTRVLPTVGCEADAVIPEIQQSTLSTSAGNVFVAFPDGCFSWSPVTLTASVKWEYALRSDLQRVRVISPDLASPQQVTLFYENRDADFSDGVILPGCGSNPNRVEEDGHVDVTGPIDGKWRRQGLTWSAASGLFQTIEDKVSRNGVTVARCFPRGVTLRKYRTLDHHTAFEAGWSIRRDKRLTVLIEYGDDLLLHQVSRFVEHKI